MKKVLSILPLRNFNNTYKARNSSYNKFKGVSGGIPLTFLFLFIFMFAGTGYLSSAEQATRRLSVIQVKNAPIIDGLFNDRGWEEASWQKDFSQPGQPGKLVEAQTKFKAIHDGKYLYFAVYLEEPFPDKLVSSSISRDGPVWNDDCIEIFLDPQGEGKSYYQIIVNSQGVLYDSFQRNPQWNANLDVATRVEADYWSVELAIPLAELGPAALTSQWWRFNVARERYAAGRQELSSFSYLPGGGFHQPEDFSLFTLGTFDTSDYCWEISQPAEERSYLLNGELCYEANIGIKNLTGKTRQIILEAKILSKEEALSSLRKELKIKKGKSEKVSLALTATQEKENHLQILIKDPLKEEILYVRDYSLDLKACYYHPLKIEFLSPQGGIVYASEEKKEIVLSVNIEVPRRELSSYNLAIDLEGYHRHYAQKEIKNPRPRQEVRLDIKDIPDGEYKVIAYLKDKEGRSFYTVRERMLKLFPFSGETRIDARGVIRVKGEPFLPLGWLAARKVDLKKLPQGTNLLISGNIPGKSNEELKSFLDQLDEKELKTCLYPYLHPHLWGIKNFVQKWKWHPALLSWIIEEPQKSSPGPKIENVYDLISGEDPYHPCLQLTPANILYHDRASWTIFPAYNAADFGKPDERVASYAQLRAMLFGEVLKGKKGFLWDNYSYHQNYPSLRLGIPYLIKEAAALKEAILAPEMPAGKIQIKPGGLPILYSLRKAGENLYLIAANISHEDQRAEFRFASPAPSLLKVISEDREVKIEKRKFVDYFSPQAVHIYSTDLSLNLKNIEEIKEEIAQAQKDLEKEGNLAFIKRGTTAIASSSFLSDFTRHILDGYTNNDGIYWEETTPGDFPDWVIINFPREEEISRLVVYSSNLKEYQVQAWGEKGEREDWVNVDTVEENTATLIVHKFAPVKTKKIRLRITDTINNDLPAAIYEIEAYQN